ncbi:MAG: HAD hydrolase-like protein [Cyanobacteria bacterium P01_E01_bin.42]
MIKAIIFDFDGTLVQSNEIKHNTYYKVAQNLDFTGINTQKIVDDVLTSGIDGTRDIVIKEIVSRIAAIGKLSTAFSLPDWVEELTADYTNICEIAIASCPEIEGTTATLEHLQNRGYLLFINSATPVKYLKRIVELRGMKDFFTGIYGRPNDKIQNLQAIFSAYSIAPQQAIAIGDGEDDLHSSLTMGCQFIGVLHETIQFASLPVYRVCNLSQLIPIVEKIENRMNYLSFNTRKDHD